MVPGFARIFRESSADATPRRLRIKTFRHADKCATRTALLNWPSKPGKCALFKLPSQSPEGNADSIRIDLYPNGRDASRRGLTNPVWRLGRSDAAFVVALILVCGLSTLIGVAAPLGSFAHDTFFLLDNAYRVVQGQVPHRDFSSAWGPIIFLIDAAGLWMSGMRPAGFGYANAVFGALLAIWAFLLVRPRWSPASACALGIYTLLLITAPFPIGIPPIDFGYAMSYNRYGYALFGIIMIECAADAPSTCAGFRQRTAGAFSTGVALGLLAFLKISYALVAGPFIAVLLICGGAGRLRRLIGLGSGFAILAVLVLCYLRFDVTDMMQDLATAAAARQLALQVLRPIDALDLAQGIVILVFVAGLISGARRAGERAARLHGGLFALLTLTAGYLLLISNQQLNTFPLNGYAAVALVAAYGPLMTGRLLQWPGVSPDFPRAVLLTACFLPFCIVNGMSLAWAAVERQWPIQTNVVALESPESGTSLLLRLVTGAHPTETAGAGYVAAVNDGLALLRRHSGDRDGVLTFDEFNPFNYLLNRPSPRGGIAAAAYNYIFSDAAHPTAERFFGDTAYLLVRKYKQGGPDILEGDDVRALMRLYGPALRSHFTMVEETEHWALWRRVDALGGSSSK